MVQVTPGDTGSVDVQDRVEDFPQIVGGGATLDADVGAGVGTGLAPGGQPGCDQAQRALDRSDG